MTKTSNFADRLRTFMVEKDYTYEQLGKLLDMNEQTLNRYVLGQRVPKIDVANEIADKLNVNQLWLQGFDVDMHEKNKPINTVVDELRESLVSLTPDLDEDQLKKAIDFVNLLKAARQNQSQQ
jgi:transcriptional regulator with XRE-family HTH domain